MIIFDINRHYYCVVGGDVKCNNTVFVGVKNPLVNSPFSPAQTKLQIFCTQLCKWHFSQQQSHARSFLLVTSSNRISHWEEGNGTMTS